MENYKVDGSGRHIKLKVDVGTSGIAVTSVFLEEDGNSNLVLESADFSGGDIPYEMVGINRKLKETVLYIRTAIGLSGIPEDKWEDEIKNVLVVKSFLKGGPQGEIEYKMKIFEVDDNDLPDVFITKQIEFTL